MFKNIYFHSTEYYIYMAILAVSVIAFFVILSMDFNKANKEERDGRK